MTRKAALAALLALLATLTVAGSAFAYWVAASTAATGSAAAATLGAPTAATSAVTATSVTVTVTAMPASGPHPSSYRVDRTAPGTTVTGVCTISAATGSCNDPAPAQGQVNQYAVYSRLGTNWVAASPATVSATVPSADATPPVVPVPTVAAVVKQGASISAAATDVGSGVASVSYYSCPGIASCVSGGSLIGTSTAGPGYVVAWTSQPADGLYQVYATATDGGGNTSTSSASATTRIDNTGPSVPTPTVAAAIRNGAALTTDATDTGSGMASVSYYSCPGTSSCVSGGTLIGSSTSGPSFSVTWSAQPADGSYQVYAVGVDNAGTSTTSAGSAATKVDNTQPNVPAPTVPANVKNGSVLTSAVTDAGSGVSSVAYFYCAGSAQCVSGGTPIGTASTGPAYSLAWTSQPADGTYQVYVAALDAAGNSRVSSTSVTTVVDNSAPTLAVSTSGANVGSNGTTVYFKPGGTGSFTVTATDPQTAITSTSFPAAPTGFTRTLGPSSATYTLSSGGASTTLAPTATNNVGLTGQLTLTLTAYTSGGAAAAVDTTNAGTAGAIASGDTLVLTYSHPMRASSLLAGWDGTSRTVTMKITDGTAGGNDVLTVSAPSGVNLGTVSLGSANWATADITWADATMSLSADGTQVTLTVGATCVSASGTCNAKLSAVSGSTTLTWTPSASALDLAGNATATTARPGASKTNF